MSSNTANLLETDRLENDESPLPKRIKVSSENSSLLQLFVENAWEKDVVENLGEWLRLRGANLDAQNWYFIWRYNSYRKENEEDTFKSKIASRLRDILPILLKCNNDIKYKDVNGQTILHVYMANDKKYLSLSNNLTEPKDLKIIKSLLDRGASLYTVDNNGQTPLHLAVNNKNITLIKPILDYVDNYIDVSDEEGETLLHKVVNRNDDKDSECSAVVCALLSKGADPTKRNKKGITPLHYIAKHCNVDLLQIFKKYKADFGVLTDKGDSLLHLAYEEGFYVEKSKKSETIRYLLKQGCDVNFKNKDGFAFIHLFAKRHFNKCTAVKSQQEYIKLGININHRTKNYQRSTSINNYKSTGVIRLESDSLKTVINALTNAGADWDERDYKGLTPLHYALLVDNSEAVSCVLKFGADINDRTVRKLLKNCGNESRNVVIQRAMERKIIGFPIDGVYQSAIDKQGNLMKHHRDKCTKEIDEMKKCIISKSDGVSVEVSLYTFMHMNWKSQLHFVSYVPRNLQQRFPIYYGLIKNVCNEAKRRRQLLVTAKTAWYEFTKIDLPDICVECILSFLNNFNLNKFIHVSETMT